MPDEKRTNVKLRDGRREYADDRKEAHDRDVKAHKDATSAEKQDEPEFHDEGYDETQPGQEEVVAGSVEHIQELKAYPNATMYSPDVNIIVPDPVEPAPPSGPNASPPVNVDVPYLEQQGEHLNCTMGNWEGEPSSYTYEWMIDGTPTGPATPSNMYAVKAGDADKTATCIVAASNSAGTVRAAPSNPVRIQGAAKGGERDHARGRDPAPPKQSPTEDRHAQDKKDK